MVAPSYYLPLDSGRLGAVLYDMPKRSISLFLASYRRISLRVSAFHGALKPTFVPDQVEQRISAGEGGYMHTDRVSVSPGAVCVLCESVPGEREREVISAAICVRIGILPPAPTFRSPRLAANAMQTSAMFSPFNTPKRRRR